MAIIQVVIDDERLARLDAVLAHHRPGVKHQRSAALRDAIDLWITDMERRQRIMAAAMKAIESRQEA